MKEFSPESILMQGNLKFQEILRDNPTINQHRNIPRYPILILTCMDPRIDVYRIFQLDPGDVLILRNAGNIYTEDVLRSILIAIHEYKITHLFILGHLNCEMTKISLESIFQKLEKKTLKHILGNYSNTFLGLQRYFRNFANEVKNIENQIIWFKDSKFLPSDLTISGMLYDPSSGWIFDFNEIQQYGLIENSENYKELIKKKETSFKTFQTSEIKKKEQKIEKINEQKLEKETFIREKLVDSRLVKLKPEFIEDFQLSCSKIKIPKIYLPKIHVNIPRVYKNMESKHNLE
ncbi:MAG: hypothetical protein EU533_01155 [Promethearchaeota archaeon]|nr:MAG: hypothetical protein EU533_01155 [Candidatus Lokiarchaeota archaeon]